MNAAEFAHILKPFIGHQLMEVLRVVVHVAEEQFELLDTAVFLRADEDPLQLLVDVHDKRLRRMGSRADIEVPGDYDDRTGVELRRDASVILPCDITAASIVYETETDTGEEYPVGGFLIGPDEKVVMGLTMHLDDLEIGPPEQLWGYLNNIVAHTKVLVIRRI